MTYLSDFWRAGLATAFVLALSNSPALALDFGDNSSSRANNGQCDDPTFTGDGMGYQPRNEDIGHDRTDCASMYSQGKIQLVNGDEPTGKSGDGKSQGTTGNIGIDDIDFGNDLSPHAYYGSCGDPRFSGPGMDDGLLDVDMWHDATDCRSQMEQGQISYTGLPSQLAAPDYVNIDFGNNFSAFAFNDECSDPRFSGPGMDGVFVLPGDLGRDASDCHALVKQGQIRLN